jgi:hypothetical protein
MDPVQVAMKRAEADALKRRFDLPFATPTEPSDSVVVEGDWAETSAPPEEAQHTITAAEASTALFGDTPNVDKLATDPKRDRPYPPDVLRSKITDKAMSLQGRSASDKQRNLAVGMLSECFAGDEHHEQKRHTVTDFLFGVDSMTKLHDNEVLALLEWLKPTQDSGGAYAPDPRSAKEAQAVVTAAMKAAGQGELI